MIVFEAWTTLYLKGHRPVEGYAGDFTAGGDKSQNECVASPVPSVVLYV